MSDTNPDQPCGSAPIGPGHRLRHSSYYHDLQFLDIYNADQHNMEGSPASPSSSFSQWDSPSSIPPPTPFPNSNTQLSGPDEGSSGEVVGNPPEFPSLFTHAETAHLSRSLPAGVIPGPLSRSEHEQPQEPPSGSFQTLGYPMHSYESPLTEDMKNPELMRNNWIFIKHAKKKVATINTIRASALRRAYPAKFKCQIQGCNADFTRKHNLENHLKSHCGVTDLTCGLCGKGFTTIPVWKRHQKSCKKAASSSDSKRFLDAVTAQRPA